ncbi:MAG: lysophospholipid transporter LplT [Candidatus Dactylopiibacterium carminicum]|nr:MAG: lysophospholipid transporter LplT [Candidatus Dactylopiibacterium carminicum]
MNTRTLNLPLASTGMFAVLGAQFFSALADNAILIVAIALVKARGAGEMAPLLQGAFVLPFILLAPFVGQIADGFPKGRVMLAANAFKLIGAVLIACGIQPILGYGLIGVGAAVYSPAKYGILSQMFAADRLVRANGMLEGSTIAAILLGVLLGGWLADHSMAWAFAGVIGAYALAAAINLLIPRLAPENPAPTFAPRALIRRFGQALRTLMRDPDARFSMLGTSVFWGCGSTLRLMLFAWVPVALTIQDNQTPANLMGVVSIGIVAGAAIAAGCISLDKVNRSLIGGLLISPIVLCLAHINQLLPASLLMATIGVCGGIFVVPLNALLQQRGHESVGAGNALAVQNSMENTVMLLFVGAYSLANRADLAVGTAMTGFGLLLSVSILLLALARLARGKATMARSRC